MAPASSVAVIRLVVNLFMLFGLYCDCQVVCYFACKYSVCFCVVGDNRYEISLKFSIQDKILAIVYVRSGLEPILEATVSLTYELGCGHSGHSLEYGREVCS